MRVWLTLIYWLVALTPSTAGTISLNDNTRAAGRLERDILNVQLVADVGSWHPAGAHGPSIEISAFGEEGADLAIPGPLIRVREGTTIVLTLHNKLPSELRLYGLCARPGPCNPLSVAAGASQNIRFSLNSPGTYFYWGATGPEPLIGRQRRDSQLGGAIVVDPREGASADRVFVISIFGDPFPAPVAKPDQFVINGGSWPYTEKLRHSVGDHVRWRVINLSTFPHAMHLHGFYFKVEATGDVAAESSLAPNLHRTVVTEFIGVGRSFVMSWMPDHPGNWLFHCHMLMHMMPPAETGHGAHQMGDGAAGMTGLVLGVEVTGSSMRKKPEGTTPRRFSLVLSEEPNRYGNASGFRMDLEGADAPRLNPGPVPGPVLVLTRGEPVEITVVNRTSKPSAIHWHGIELDSFFDGVPGLSGLGTNLAPPVAAGSTFVAKFAPPRAGTFIYHTHWHDEVQLSSGLYGALIVLEPGQHYDPQTDHIVIIGLNGLPQPFPREPLALNGSAKPQPIVMRAGVPNRIRLINITADSVGLTVLLKDGLQEANWKALAKDGATLPPEQAVVRPARQLATVGETYDFEIQPSRGQQLWLEVLRLNGLWLMQAPIRIQ